MKLNSSIFNRIRIKSDEPEADKAPEVKLCEHPGCLEAGLYKAPKGRGNEGKFHMFCMTHVKAYNAKYNYFNGMSDDAVADFQKDAHIGHRPTWKLGVNSKAARMAERADPTKRRKAGPKIADPFDMFETEAEAARAAKAKETEVGNAARKALATLDLEPTADAATVKARYKELVKRLHPDANGGDRSREVRLTEIIKAYGYLKTIKRV
jgi:DnaJ domain